MGKNRIVMNRNRRRKSLIHLTPISDVEICGDNGLGFVEPLNVNGSRHSPKISIGKVNADVCKHENLAFGNVPRLISVGSMNRIFQAKVCPANTEVRVKRNYLARFDRLRVGLECDAK